MPAMNVDEARTLRDALWTISCMTIDLGAQQTDAGGTLAAPKRRFGHFLPPKP
jgi:hypothetical protein